MGILTSENESSLSNGRGTWELKQPMSLIASTFNTGQSAEWRGVISTYFWLQMLLKISSFLLIQIP